MKAKEVGFLFYWVLNVNVDVWFFAFCESASKMIFFRQQIQEIFKVAVFSSFYILFFFKRVL